jgi:uncharacterized protein (DUF1501 family)
MAVTRRGFLRLSATGLVALGGLPVWRSARAAQAGAPLLVVVFLRGGADGLSLVPPTGDPAYASLRGPLAVEGALPFAPGFGLHPALAPLAPLAAAGRLAVVHCAGSHDASRSHFEAQDRMEIALGGRARLAAGGWLTRALGPVEASSPFRQLAFGLAAPTSLHGADAFALGHPAVFRLGGASREAIAALEARYRAAGDDPAGRAGLRALDAARAVRSAVLEGELRARPRREEPAEMGEPEGGGRGPELFARQIEGLDRLDAAGFAIEAAALELGGWDTHAGQVGPGAGGFDRPAAALAAGLADLAGRFEGRRRLRVVAMTEFGRTVRCNGSRGSDHGHGSVMLVLAPDARGGIHGDWPGLSEGALFEGRDLAVRTDYRNVLHELLSAHLGGPPPADAFPDFTPSSVGLFPARFV